MASEPMRRVRLGLLVLVAFVVALGDIPENVQPWQPWAAVVAGVSAASIVVARAAAPWGLVATLAALVAVALGAELADEPGQVPFGQVLVVAGLLAHAAWWRPLRTVVALGAGAFATAIVIELFADGRGPSDAALTALVWSVAMSVSLAVRWRRQAAEAGAERVRTVERERIARELHDVVAHHVSAIAMTAEGGRSANDLEVADRSLAAIHSAATTTLDEMRRVVGVLRDAQSGAPRRLADLAVGFSQVDGPTIVVDLPDDLAEPSAPVTAAIHRIAQEAVTNARRHATGATRVDISIATDGVAYTVVIDDDGRTAGAAGPGGHGVIGMTERAHLLGGRLTAGPRPEGGWRVAAELPALPAPLPPGAVAR